MGYWWIGTDLTHVSISLCINFAELQDIYLKKICSETLHYCIIGCLVTETVPREMFACVCEREIKTL